MVTTIEGGRSLSSRPGFRLVVALDALAHVALAVWAVASGFTQNMDGLAFWMLVGYVVAVVANDVGALGLNASAMAWRRRMALVAVLATIMRGSPFETHAWQVAAVLDGAILWIVLLVEGRRVSRAVAEATGEHVLSADPSKPDR
jgi:hypothetical protein